MLMPIRNVVKVFVADSYYHVYSRGWNLTEIFLDEEDYTFFENLLIRHLSPLPLKDKKGREYAHFYPVIRLNAYCLIGNHFHMLVHQNGEDGMTKLMKSILVAYTTYFNKKYDRRGSLFESTYKAVRIDRTASSCTLHATFILIILLFVHGLIVATLTILR